MGKYTKNISKSFLLNKSKLPHLDFELTERCNNNCIHCCINKSEFDDKCISAELSTEQVKAVLTQAVQLGCLQVRFTGGEPLLRPDFEEIYKFSYQNGMKVIVFTNGRLINEALLSLFIKMPPELLEITVYGMKKSTYDRFTRTSGAFQEFRNGITLLERYHIPYIIKSVYHPILIKDIPLINQWAHNIPIMNGKPPIYSIFYDLRSRNDSTQKNQSIRAQRISPSEAYKFLSSNPNYKEEIAEFARKFIGPSGDRLFNCGAGKSLCVDPYGYIQPCMGIRSLSFDYKLGFSLSDALQLFSNLQMMEIQNHQYLEKCSKCFLLGFCEQCPAKSFDESGTFDTPVDYFCEIAHYFARQFGWLKPNEYGWEVVDWQKRIQ